MALWHDPDFVFVIAEIGVNHNGSADTARKLVDVATKAGADAVKFQTFDTDALAASSADMARYQKKNLKREGDQASMLRALELDATDYSMLKDHCVSAGIKFMSTPFDEGSADLLEGLGVELFKISSGDLTHPQLLTHVARKGLPMVVSTGMGNMGEIEQALEVIANNGDPEVALLHCVSNYPAAMEDCNLSAMATMHQAFNVPVGWSDHTIGNVSTIAAVAMGASIIEKHFTLDKTMEGPDHSSSLEPDELKDIVASIRMVSSAIGDGIKRPTAAERETALVARRSLVAAKDIAAGQELSADSIVAKRPGTGIAPGMSEDVVGLKAARDIAADTVLKWSDFGGQS